MKAFIAVLLAAFVAVSLADDCDKHAIHIVQEEWETAYYNTFRGLFAETIWSKFFAAVPEAKALLKDRGSDDVHSHKFHGFAISALAHMDLAINFLSNDYAEKPFAAYLHKRHAGKNIPAAYVDKWVEAFLDSITTQVGHWTHKAEWKACLTHIASAVKSS